MKSSMKVKRIEECWVLTGQRRGGVWMLRRRRYSTGAPTRVCFDAGWALEREETYGDVLGFLHTHPTGPARPSGRDLRTMSAWSRSFGKPMVCLIAAPGATAGWVFDQNERLDVARIVPFTRGLTVVVE